MVIVLPMLIVALAVSSMSISDHRRARLSFRTVLDAMKIIRKEKKSDRKMKLIRKRVRWFRDGLRSFNSYLYSKKITHFQMIDIDQYHLSVCSVVLMGKQIEMDTIAEQIKLALSSIGERKGEGDFRNFLTAMKNLKNMEKKKEYSLSELNKMITILSFSERVKESLRSPYISILTSVAIGALAIIFEVMRFIWR